MVEVDEVVEQLHDYVCVLGCHDEIHHHYDYFLVAFFVQLLTFAGYAVLEHAHQILHHVAGVGTHY